MEEVKRQLPIVESRIIFGDNRVILKEFPDSYFDSCVTDPPYELGFMGKKWDATGIAYDVELWKEVLRVLKPGGHLLSFGGTRTYHRMTCAIEDAGFEIRDCIQWLYGSGFPKSLDVSKAIDKKAGVKRSFVKYRESDRPNSVGNKSQSMNGKFTRRIETAPNTEGAKKWSGYGTALKPANEPIVMARRPLSEKTVAANVLKWGTGGINIDVSRIETVDDLNGGAYAKKGTERYKGSQKWGFERGKAGKYSQPKGRFPANIILDKKSGKMLGEPSRFFYCAKTSKKERGDGNIHPTVKPIMLMKYLVCLVTPKNGRVLDPFMGSGSTGLAIKEYDNEFVGIEINKEYYEIARARFVK